MRRGGLARSFFASIAVAFALFALAGYQVTSETAATRLLGRLAAAVVQIDRWLPAHQEDLDLLARDKPQSNVEFADLPLAISLPATQIVGAEPAVLREVIVRNAGLALYHDGSDVLRTPDGEASLGIDEPVRWTATLLGEGAHGFWRLVLPVALLIALGLCAAVFFAGRQPLIPVTVGAVIALLASLGAWTLAQAGSNAVNSAVDQEIMLIVRDGAWIGVRNALAAAAASGSLLFLTRLLAGDTRPERVWEATPNASSQTSPTDAPPV
jgi:hypothetical protein